MRLIVIEIPDDCPTCDKCGVPVETASIAMICPYKEQCEFWPEGGIAEPFASMFGLASQRD